MKAILRYILPCLGLLMAAACTDDDDWTAGPAAKDGCQQVHFASPDKQKVSLNYDDPDDRTVTLVLRRNTTQGALSVPLTASADNPAVGLPAAAEFADGADSATVAITVPADAADGDKYSVELAIESDEADPYAKFEREGGSTFACAITVASKPMAAVARFGDRDIDALFGGDIAVPYLKTGDDTYLMTDFFQSGTDVTLTVDRQTGVVSLSETNSYVYQNYWYFCTADGDWRWLYPNYRDEQSNVINSFYAYTDGTADYTYWDEATQTLYIWVYFGVNYDYDTQYSDCLAIHFGDVPARDDQIYWTGTFEGYGGAEGVGDTFGGELSYVCRKNSDTDYTIVNFLNSGTDVHVLIDPETNAITLQETNSYVYDNYWYLVDGTEEGNYLPCYPNYPDRQSDYYISGFCAYTDGSADYTYWDPATRTAHIYAGFCVNGDFDTWYYYDLALRIN